MGTDVYECNHIGKSTNDILIEAGMAIKYLVYSFVIKTGVLSVSKNSK